MTQPAAPPVRAIGDPSDKATDAAADGQFTAHRAGYGSADARTRKAIEAAERGWTLAAGEGKLVADRLRAAEAEASAYKRRWWIMQSEGVFIERWRESGHAIPWLEPAHRFRCIDIDSMGIFYGDSAEEVTDALAQFWDEFQLACEQAARNEAGAGNDGGMDAF